MLFLPKVRGQHSEIKGTLRKVARIQCVLFLEQCRGHHSLDIHIHITRTPHSRLEGPTAHEMESTGRLEPNGIGRIAARYGLGEWHMHTTSYASLQRSYGRTKRLWLYSLDRNKALLHLPQKVIHRRLMCRGRWHVLAHFIQL